MTTHRAGGSGWWNRWAAGTVAAAVILFGCYLLQSRTVAAGSDGASQALQAWDLVHGNPLLRGWWMTDVSFYTTELPQYALLELARGLTPDVLHVGGAMTYTLLVLAAGFLARGRATGAAGAARALVAAAIMLAPQLGDGTQTLLLSPDHTGTSVPLLLIFLAIDRFLVTDGPGRALDRTRRRRRWYIPVLVFLALGAAMVADALTLVVAIIPVALVTAIRARRREASVGVAAALAYPAALAATALLRAAGGWQVNGLQTAVAPAARLGQNARLTGEGLLELFGANVFGASTLIDVTFAIVHLVSLLAVAFGVIVAARGFSQTNEFIPAVLVCAIAIDVAGYLAGVQAANLLSTREIAPVLPFAAVLAGRALGDRLALRSAPAHAHAHKMIARRTAVAVAVLYAAALGHAAAQPPAVPQAENLAAWLTVHHFTHGLSGYHEANIVTLESGGAVILRPVAPGPVGTLVPYTWNANQAWFGRAAPASTFLVLAPVSRGESAVNYAEAIATFGKQVRTRRFGEYSILTWTTGQNLLARLR